MTDTNRTSRDLTLPLWKIDSPPNYQSQTVLLRAVTREDAIAQLKAQSGVWFSMFNLDWLEKMTAKQSRSYAKLGL